MATSFEEVAVYLGGSGGVSVRRLSSSEGVVSSMYCACRSVLVRALWDPRNEC